MKTRKMLLILPLFILIIFAGCGTTPELISTTPNNISIDGNAADWGANLKYFPDEKAAIGVSNNNQYLYLCLTTNDLGSIMPMFAKGFVVWLENEKSDSSIGIKYPLHNIVNEAKIMINPEAFQEKGRGMMLKKIIDEQNEIRILNKDNFPVTSIPTSDSSGLTARIGYNNDQFVYELRVPINNNKEKYYIHAIPGEKILVKFETETPERRNFGERGGGMMQPGGGMGNPGGDYGSESGGGDRPHFNPINFKVEVTLK